jgi:hypothetical protein
MRRPPVRWLLAGLLLLLARAAGAAPGSYDLLFDVRLLPTERIAKVSLRVRQAGPTLRSLLLLRDPERHLGFEADGPLAEEAMGLRWTPPREGGRLRFTVRLDHLRDAQSYDARITDSWAVFRGDDLFPPVRARTTVGALSRARLRLRLPSQWSAAVPYERNDDGSYAVERPGRAFDRPVGWMVAARRLGVVRERVAGVSVGVAGPVGHHVPRLDLLALLRWTLPRLRSVLPLPERLLVVSAGDPMWRGGLSGPGSLFVHASRPLLTPDGTSPLLHELVHTVLARSNAPGDDWIVEGLAELYALEMLVRSGTISSARYERALEKLAERGLEAPSVRVTHSEGAVTARAATLLHDLDERIRRHSQGAASLDAVVRVLAALPEPLSTQRLREASEQAAGVSLEGWFDRPELATPVP